MTDDELAALARRHLDVRRLRYEEFPALLFDEYAWDMLLHLFVAQAPVEDEVLGAAVYTTPAVWGRWLTHLATAGQIVRAPGGSTTLSEKARDEMRRYLTRVADTPL